MDSGKAILGVFLATYSSKGDYLPLRYPTTRHAYECAEVLLRRAAAHRHEAAAEQARAGDGADDAGSDTNAASAAAGFMRGTYKDAPSRVGSYTSVGNANTAASVPDEGARLLEPGLEGPSERHPKMDDKIRGFDPSFLAQLFSPRPSMSDQRFQVAIDNVLFVGHPLRDDPNEKTLDPDYYDAEQDDAETMSRLASLTECDGWQVKSDIMLNRGANPQATKLLADLGLVNLVLNREPSEAGDSAISAGEREVRDSREWKRRGYRKRVYPRLFHVVFMLDNTAPGVETVADRLYEHVLLRLTKTLMIEQMEANYVLTQSRLMRSLNDQAHAERYSTARYLHEALRRSTLAADLIELFNGLHRGELVSLHVRKRVMLSLQIPRGPPLARAPPPARPRLLFSTDAKHCASAGASAAYGGSGATSAAHTPRPATPSDAPAPRAPSLGGAATRSVAPDAQDYWGPLFAPASASAAESRAVVTDRELQPGEVGRYPRIEPHHAVLLLGGGADALLRRLRGADASPTLLAIVERALPTEPLSELHARVDCSFAQLCRVVAHLVYWGAARLVCPVKLAHTYVPTAPTAPGVAAGVLERYARQRFGPCSLPRLLAAMHPPRPAELVLRALVAAPDDAPRAGDDALGARVRDAKPAFREALAFLLREGAIAQYHTWPTVLVPSYVKLDLSEAQFVRLALGWLRTLHAEHPDLLGAFPHALLDGAELECWRAHASREQAGLDVYRSLAHDAEARINLCHVMRKLALRRVRDAGCDLKRGKHGRELRHAERRMEADERSVHAFCNRMEAEGMEALLGARGQYSLLQDQALSDRVQDRRAHGKDIPEGGGRAMSAAQLCKWYDFVKRDPDLGELTKEIVAKYVSYVPTDGPPQRTEAEKRYLAKLVEGKQTTLQDWFHRHSHLFTGANHLVKLFSSEKIALPRAEAMLREFGGVILLPQHT